MQDLRDDPGLEESDGPLAGIRVLDLTRVLAGPLATMMLGDLGAHVIKVERPGIGDETRGWGPPFDAEGRAAYYLAVNRNKLSIALDFAAPADRALLRSLVAGADVVVDNFLPGALKRQGIDADALLERHPHLVWCTVTGFGVEDPRPGYDFVVQAEAGWMAITGAVEGEPSKVGVALVDVITGKDAAIAILAAVTAIARGVPLAARQRRLAVALRTSATAALVNVAQNALVSGREPARWGNAHANLVPYELYRAADRPLVIAVGSDAQWQALLGVLELAELAADEALRRNAGRVAQRERVVAAVAACVARRPASHWITALTSAGIPCGLVRSVGEALAEVRASPETGVAPATGGTVRLRPPALDEHGGVIRALGWEAFGRISGLA